MLSASIATSIREFMDFGAIDPALVGEEEQPIMGRCGEEVFDNVILFKCSSFYAFTATTLGAIEISAGAFCVAASRNRHNNFLVRNQIFDREIGIATGDDLGLAVIAILFSDLF